MRRLLVFAVIACARAARADADDRALYEEGVKLRGIAEYAQAADAFERFARARPADDTAPGALSDAVALRLALGDDRKAEDDAEQYLKAYATRTDDAANLALALLLHAGERGEWAKVERDAPRRMPLIERGPLTLAILAHAALARAYASHPGDARASREYARVRTLGEHLREPPTSSSADLRRFAKALDAVGEALVFAADEKRDATRWAPFPPYAGGDVDAWLASKVTPWIAARSAAIRALSDEYKKVSDLQPIPPPRWVVAASGRVAQMWARASDEMTVPRAAKSVKDAFRDAQAKPAALACTRLAVKFEYFDDASQACGAWLERNYRREFPPLDELLVAPRLRDSNPLRVDPVRP